VCGSARTSKAKLSGVIIQLSDSAQVLVSVSTVCVKSVVKIQIDVLPLCLNSSFPICVEIKMLIEALCHCFDESVETHACMLSFMAFRVDLISNRYTWICLNLIVTIWHVYKTIENESEGRRMERWRRRRSSFHVLTYNKPMDPTRFLTLDWAWALLCYWFHFWSNSLLLIHYKLIFTLLLMFKAS
jgi:hypothetical protein